MKFNSKTPTKIMEILLNYIWLFEDNLYEILESDALLDKTYFSPYKNRKHWAIRPDDLKNKTIEQFVVGDYRIDLYFPDERIAIECDEDNHIRYKNDPEREAFIIQILHCSFLRFNPDEPGFNIGEVIAILIDKIYGWKNLVIYFGYTFPFIWNTL